MEELESFFQRNPFGGVLKSIDEFFENHTLFQAGFPVRLYDTPDDWIVEAELPGVKRENIHIELHGSRIRLIVRDDVEMEARHKEKSTYAFERQFSHTERMIHLPYTIDKTRTHASFTNGILKIRGPKFPKTGHTLTIEP
jgi:HSP20 family protein